MRVSLPFPVALFAHLALITVAATAMATPLAADTVADRFVAPDGLTAVAVPAGSFGAYLQALPLSPAGTPVRRYDGVTVAAPWAKAVVDLDVGRGDLQQCADSALRLRAEWARHSGAVDDLTFHATSGDPIPLSRYRRGEHAVAVKNRLGWRGDVGVTRPLTDATWHAWLDTVFMYAGSISLAKDTVAVSGPMQPGDLLVVGGSPGHVLVVLGVARGTDGREAFLLGQGFMPAQSFHVLGWFSPNDDGGVKVPSWPVPFERQSRRRFR